ncbi:Uncharacterised protein [Mycobacteroides abscessus subsp. abscessus]|nr:Uncharacterised protein [Mycobacteroides abscessus subsp. abscessus]
MHAGNHPETTKLPGLRGGHHFEVLQAVATPRHRGYPVPLGNPAQGVDNLGDGGIAYHVEPRRDAGPRARIQMRFNCFGVQMSAAAGMRRVVIGLP